jgi:hypothetical protein
MCTEEELQARLQTTLQAKLQAIQSGDVVRYVDAGQIAHATVAGFRQTYRGIHMLQVFHSRREEISLDVVVARIRERGPDAGEVVFATTLVAAGGDREQT